MTHTLHRHGSPEALRQDYVLLVTAPPGLPDGGERILQAYELVRTFEPVNVGAYEVGSLRAGASEADLRASLLRIPRLRCAFSGRESIMGAVRLLRAADLGLSVVLQGPLADILKDCVSEGIRPHTATLSLGVWGPPERVPGGRVLELITQCGHGQVGPALAAEVCRQVDVGELSVAEGVDRLLRPCVCGVFNPDRAADTLARKPADLA